jgi:hypothetical protein
MLRFLALAVLLAAVSASAETGEFAPSAAGIDFSGLRSAAQLPPAGAPFEAAPGALGAPLRSIPLAPLLDGVRATKAVFRAGNVVVHVFGGKSENKKNWFIGFAPEGGEAQLFKGWKVLRWMVKHGAAHFWINGRQFTAHIDGKATDRLNSLLVVEPANKGEGRSSWTIQELSDDAWDAGAPVQIGGKEYRLMYTRDFNEDDQGGFAGYTGDRSITLMTRIDGKMIGYHWFEREIPSDRVLISTPKAAGADETTAGTFTIGLRLNAGALEIYPATTAVASR